MQPPGGTSSLTEGFAGAGLGSSAPVVWASAALLIKGRKTRRANKRFMRSLNRRTGKCSTPYTEIGLARRAFYRSRLWPNRSSISAKVGAARGSESRQPGSRLKAGLTGGCVRRIGVRDVLAKGSIVVTYQCDLGSPVLSAKIFLFPCTPNHL